LQSEAKGQPRRAKDRYQARRFDAEALKDGDNSEYDDGVANRRRDKRSKSRVEIRYSTQPAAHAAGSPTGNRPASNKNSYSGNKIDGFIDDQNLQLG
jgi:hypothetical protein